MASGNSTITYKLIPGFPGYRAGSDGTVWSCWLGPSPNGPWKKLKPGIHKRRTASRTYLYLHLWRGGKRHTRLVHRIILDSFVGPRPRGCECRHLDGNPLNNSLTNICWGTHEENTADSRRHGKFATKLTEEQVREIRRRYSEGGVLHRELAKEFGTTTTNVGCIIRMVSWSHLT